jgi:hypothetical protein
MEYGRSVSAVDAPSISSSSRRLASARDRYESPKFFGAGCALADKHGTEPADRIP